MPERKKCRSIRESGEVRRERVFDERRNSEDARKEVA